MTNSLTDSRREGKHLAKSDQNWYYCMCGSIFSETRTLIIIKNRTRLCDNSTYRKCENAHAHAALILGYISKS